MTKADVYVLNVYSVLLVEGYTTNRVWWLAWIVEVGFLVEVEDL